MLALQMWCWPVIAIFGNHYWVVQAELYFYLILFFCPFLQVTRLSFCVLFVFYFRHSPDFPSHRRGA